jgi:hypothetical protein
MGIRYFGDSGWDWSSTFPAVGTAISGIFDFWN